MGVPPPDLNASSPAEGGSNVDAVGLICFDDRRLNSRQLHTSWLISNSSMSCMARFLRMA